MDEPNALALEYQRVEGTARRDVNIADLVNNPVANGKCRVLGLSFSEEVANRLFTDASAFSDDRPNPLLVGQY